MKEHIANIIYKELNALPLTDQEKTELSLWLAQSSSNSQIYASLSDKTELRGRLTRRLEWQKAAENAFIRFSKDYPNLHTSAPDLPKMIGKTPVYSIPLFKRRWFAYAATVLMVLGIGAYLWNMRGSSPSLAQHDKSSLLKADVSPGSNKAILTLAGGGIIMLDSAGNGLLAEQGGVKVIKSSDGQIAYNSGIPEASGQIMFNTMSTPRGGQYQVTLSDGTKVWLNAASSITYPTAFIGDRREVSIVGEAYFEVAKNAGQAFIVKTGESEVEVLGTHFNINAYADEPAIKTTLLEGKIKISNKQMSKVLLPGEQAVVDDKLEVNKNADIELIMAWKNGLFEFRDQPIESIMRQVSRWYNLNVVYEGKISYHFNASVSRGVPVSRLFRLLESTSMVHFSINNNTIIVKP